MTETAPERETGSETAACPNCGKTLAVETRADGSTVPTNCTKCYPEATKKEVAASIKGDDLPREVGTSPANQVQDTTTEEKA